MKLRRATPWLAATVLLLSLWGFYDWPHPLLRFGLVPAYISKKHGLTLFTCLPFHTTWLHLIGNLIFLLTYGNAVEKRAGSLRFLLLFFASGLLGSLFHTAILSLSEEVAVGASAGVAGLVANLTLSSPREPLVWIRNRGFFPAWSGLIIAMVIQIYGAWLHAIGLSQASIFGHLGGAAGGLIFILFRQKGLPWHRSGI